MMTDAAGAYPPVSSAEARWFFPGPLPPAALDWLAAGRPLTPEPPRVDYYLLLPGLETVGVKWRQGRLEIKRRTGPARLFRRRWLVGRQEQWVKWAWAMAGVAPAAVPSHFVKLREASWITPPAAWLAVSKQRYLQRWGVADGRLTAVAAQLPPPAAGCNLEWTEAQWPTQPGAPTWFTLGVEAYGPPAETLALFRLGLTQLLAAGPPPHLTLTAATALSYPAWLSRRLPEVGLPPPGDGWA